MLPDSDLERMLGAHAGWPWDNHGADSGVTECLLTIFRLVSVTLGLGLGSMTADLESAPADRR